MSKNPSRSALTRSFPTPAVFFFISAVRSTISADRTSFILNVSSFSLYRSFGSPFRSAFRCEMIILPSAAENTDAVSLSNSVLSSRSFTAIPFEKSSFSSSDTERPAGALFSSEFGRRPSAFTESFAAVFFISAGREVSEISNEASSLSSIRPSAIS